MTEEGQGEGFIDIVEIYGEIGGQSDRDSRDSDKEQYDCRE